MRAFLFDWPTPSPPSLLRSFHLRRFAAAVDKTVARVPPANGRQRLSVSGVWGRSPKIKKSGRGSNSG